MMTDGKGCRNGSAAGKPTAIARLIAVVAILSLVGCGRPLEVKMPGTTVTHVYPTVGLFTLDQRSPDICYEVSVGNVIWSIILIESIVFPVYFVGWSIMNPVRPKTGPNDTCAAYETRYSSLYGWRQRLDG